MTRPQGRWRLLVHPPTDGAWNMAVDEAVLDRFADTDGGRARPTLRLYGWRPAALSLGRSQPPIDPAPLRAEGIDWVRRPTGGWAVLHDNERTYAVIGALRDRVFGSSVHGIYRKISEALAGALGSLGADVRSAGNRVGRTPRPADGPPGACFTVTSAHEILAGGRKLVGSAQLRRRQAFLQHGSIPIATPTGRLGRLLGQRIDESRFTDLERAIGRSPTADELDRALCRSFARLFDVELIRGELTDGELEHATRLRAHKHLSLKWVRDGINEAR